MMMNKIKKILLHKSGTTTTKSDKNVTQEENRTTGKKKKSFSLLLKTAMIDPNNEIVQHSPKIKYISKSSSFLQLQSFTATPIKRNRSMFGQFYSNDKNGGGVTTTAEEDNNYKTTSSAILDYYAASTTNISENILHTAAVSISSAYGTINSQSTTILKLYGDDQQNNENNKYLQLGIQFYEKGELEQASYYWRLSAENDSPLGIFFYGLALRHGWGCRKSPALAVRFLQKAAEYSVYDLQTDITRFISVVKIESLVLSIYELGEFFWHGWEVPKSVTIASYYFQVASNMGNTDAMNDLAFCYKHGHGVDKDDHKAAQLYKMAEQKGNGLKNNSWIWEEQYNQVENSSSILL